MYESMKTWFDFGPRKPTHLICLFSGLSPLKALNCLVVVLVTILVEEQEGDGELDWPLQYCIIFSLHGVELNSDSISIGHLSSTSIGPYFETEFVSSKMGIKVRTFLNLIISLFLIKPLQREVDWRDH